MFNRILRRLHPTPSWVSSDPNSIEGLKIFQKYNEEGIEEDVIRITGRDVNVEEKNDDEAVAYTE